MASTTMTGSPGADPWADTRPRCRVRTGSPQFVSLVRERLGEDVILLDAGPPGEREAVLVDCRHSDEELVDARKRWPTLPLVAVVNRLDAGQMVELLATGTEGVIALTEPDAAWRECVNVVLGGGRWLGGPGMAVCLEQREARHSIALHAHRADDVTLRTRRFVAGRVGQKFRT